MGLGRAACSLAELALAFNWQMPGASKPANSDLDEYAGINGLQKYHSIYTAASSSKRTLVTQAVWLQCDLVTTDGSDVEAEAEAYVCRLTTVHACYETACCSGVWPCLLRRESVQKTVFVQHRRRCRSVEGAPARRCTRSPTSKLFTQVCCGCSTSSAHDFILHPSFG